MSLRTIPVAAELLGLVAAGQPEALMIWEERDGRRQLTDRPETDPDTGELLWTAFVMPSAAERPEVLQVRVPARQQPVVTLFGPVALDNLSVNVRIDKSGRLAQYWSAAGIRDAGPGQRRNGSHGEQKTEQASA